jgi:L-lactate dehydrogenase (cytochrome)
MGRAHRQSKGFTLETMPRRAVDVGAKALVVSNHGGRQLDSVAPTLRILPEVAASVGDQIRGAAGWRYSSRQRYCQSSVLGARAVMVGRAYAYGLGAAGGAGVARAIEICALI